MFSRLWSSSSVPNTKADAEEPPESTASASPPPPSESVAATALPAAPKPKKPRAPRKKAAPKATDAPDASTNGDAGLKVVVDSAEPNGTGFKDIEGLRELIAAVPPKTLHVFLKQRLDVQRPGTKKRPNANVFPTLDADYPVISAFFTGLTAPPKQHCVRCHQDYFDIDNGPRSCVKEHDDDSAIVRGFAASVHRTFWGCCGQTVDGDGDQGPPTGWCYEGPHTTDREEARYRQDGTPEDDHLGDCTKLRCGQASRKLKRKRADSVDSDSDEDIPISALEPRARHGRRKSEAGRKSMAELATDDDIDMEDATPEKKPKPKAAPRKKKSDAAEEKQDSPAPTATLGVPKTKGKAPRAKKGAEESGTEAPAGAAAGAKKAAKKRKTSD